MLHGSGSHQGVLVSHTCTMPMQLNLHSMQEPIHHLQLSSRGVRLQTSPQTTMYHFEGMHTFIVYSERMHVCLR